MKGVRIACPGCSQESVLKVVKKFDGLRVVGETKVCAFCGHEFPGDDIPVVEEKRTDFFDDVGKGNVCRNCINFVVNPWMQKCVLRDREVDALDSCASFEVRTPGEKAGE